MKKESLEKAKYEIIKVLHNSDIEAVDKLELIINIATLIENYEEDIKILIKNKNRW